MLHADMTKVPQARDEYRQIMSSSIVFPFSAAAQIQTTLLITSPPPHSFPTLGSLLDFPGSLKGPATAQSDSVLPSATTIKFHTRRLSRPQPPISRLIASRRTAFT